MSDVHQIYELIDQEWDTPNDTSSSFHSIELMYVTGRDDCAINVSGAKNSRPFAHWALGLGPTFYYFLSHRTHDGFKLRRDLRENLTSCKFHHLSHATPLSTYLNGSAILLLSSLVTLRWSIITKIAPGQESRIFVALLISLLVRDPKLLDVLLSDEGLPRSLGSDGFVRDENQQHPSSSVSSASSCVMT